MDLINNNKIIRYKLYSIQIIIKDLYIERKFLSLFDNGFNSLSRKLDFLSKIILSSLFYFYSSILFKITSLFYSFYLFFSSSRLFWASAIDSIYYLLTNSYSSFLRFSYNFRSFVNFFTNSSAFYLYNSSSSKDF